MKKIRWNEVTWYSKLVALLLFVGLPFFGFWLGVRYGKAVWELEYAPSVLMQGGGQEATE